MAAEVVSLCAVRRLRAERDHRVAEDLCWLDLELAEVSLRVSEWARVLGESSEPSELDRARRWLLRLAEQRDGLEAEKRALLSLPRAGGRSR